MNGAVLIILAILPVAALLLLASSARHRGSGLMKALLWLTVFHELLLVCWPVVYSVAVDYAVEREYALNTGALVAVMAGETVFVTMFVLGFLSLGTLGARPGSLRRLADPAADRVFLYLLVIVGLAIQLSQFLTPIESFADVTQHAELVVSDTLVGNIWAWTKGALHFPSLVAATICLLSPKAPTWLRIAAVITLAAVAAIGIAAGVRGRAIWVVSLLVVVALLADRKRVVVIAAGLMLVLVPVSPFLAGTMRSIYYTELTGGSRFEALARIGEQFTNPAFRVETDDYGVVESFYRRAQGPRNSTVLYGLRDDGQGAGVRPILGALVLPVPRRIWPTKPPAGSIDDTNYGQAIFLVRRIGYGAPLYNMGPMLASAHAYWEGGWVWLVIAGALTGLFWRGVVRWSDRYGEPIALVFGLTFGSALLIDGFLTMLYPVYNLIDIIWSSILPLVVLRLAVTLAWGALASVLATHRGSPAGTGAAVAPTA